jgi:hypothetical protein
MYVIERIVSQLIDRFSKGKYKVALSMSRRQVGGIEVQLHWFLISTLDGGELSYSHYGRFTLGEELPCH